MTLVIRGGLLPALLAGAAGLGAQAQDGTAPPASDERPGTIPVDDDEPAAATAEAGATRLEPITVTGSRIRRVDYETAAPVLVITREAIERSGHVNVGELLQELPEAGSAQNRNMNHVGNGQTEFDLRNLGSHRTVVLVDGHRWINGVDPFNTTAVDLNSFPVSLVERIEVLKDGASAIYGSDAITGVANIITRKDVAGTALNAHWGAFDRGDGVSQRYNLSGGLSTGRSRLFVDLGYLVQEALHAGDRERSSVPKAGTGMSRGSLYTPRGHALFFAEPQVADALNAVDPDNCPDTTVSLAEIIFGTDIPEGAAPAGGSRPLCNVILHPGQTIGPGETLATSAQKYRPWDALVDPYNYAPLNYLLTPFQQGTAFVRFSHPAGALAELDLQFLYNRYRSARRLAETPLFFGSVAPPGAAYAAYIDRSNIFNPFDQDIGRYASQDTRQDFGPPGPGYGLVLRRMEEAGPRFLNRDNDVAFLRMGLTGASPIFGHDLAWELGGSHGRNHQVNRQSGDLDLSRVKLALGPAAACEAEPACVPLNLFGAPGTAGAITQPMLDYITIETSGSARYTASNLYAGVSGVLPRWFLLAAPGLAAGFEWRSEDFSESPDPYQIAGISSASYGRKPTIGGRDALEAYAETSWPLLRGLPVAEELELILAARRSEYTDLAAATTWKGGLRYKPVANLLLRGTWSEGFRAPSITERFLGETDAYVFGYFDPCYDVSRLRDETVSGHCDAEGAPTANPEGYVPVRHVFGGNPAVRAEAAQTWTAGLVYSPGFVEELSVNADYYHIELDHYIGYLGPDFILDSCYRRPEGAPRPDTCDLVTRNDAGSITQIDLRTYNFDRAVTSGFDLGLEYALPLGRLPEFARVPGTVKFRLDSQYLERFDTFLAATGGPSQAVPEAGLVQSSRGTTQGDYPLPRYKASATLLWSAGSWQAGWGTRYLRGYTEPCRDHIDHPSVASYGVCSDPDTTFPADPDLVGDDRSTNRVGDTWYHRVHVGYTLRGPDARVLLGIDNVLDQDPPLAYSTFANTYPATLYSAPQSRRPYLKVAIGF